MMAWMHSLVLGLEIIALARMIGVSFSLLCLETFKRDPQAKDVGNDESL